MKRATLIRRWLPAGLAFVIAAGALHGCGRRSAGTDAHEEAGAHDHDEARGPQGGRLFSAEGVRLELAIAEDGIPPEFRAWVYDERDRLLPPSDSRLTVVLARFGGRRDSLAFRPEKEFLRSETPVVEPHSFDARVMLDHGGRRHEWTFTQQEGRVELLPEAVERGHIEIGTAGPQWIELRVETPGEVKLNAERVAQVRARFPGVVRRLERRLGDRVAEGNRLAIVHSNESFADYDVRSPLAGTVVAREATEGQAIDHENVLYTVADLSNVWVEFALYPQAAGRVRPGQTVRIRTASGDSLEARGVVSYVGPLLEQDTRVSYGRVVLPNRGGRWTPGLYVTAAITVDRVRAAVAVPEEAIVRTSRGAAVFRAQGSTFELQPVEVGRSDGQWTEIRDGLEAGATIVVRNAFLLKAELGKTEATHEH